MALTQCNFTCLNCTCEHAKEPSFKNRSFVLELEVAEKAWCPSQEDMEQNTCPNNPDTLLKYTGLNSQSITSYNTFDGLPKAEKKKILRKRSHDHFNKEIAEKKRHMLNAPGLSDGC